MAWNQPGNNGQDRDPWGGSNNNGGNSNGNDKQGRDNKPRDLDDIFRKLSKKLSGLGGDGSHGPKMGGGVITLIVVAAVAIWAGTGFYTIKEAERGVVTRFGKFSHLVQPGLNWKPSFIDNVRPVNIETTRELATSGVMLTADENVVRVEMNIQYRVIDPVQYLYSVTNADDSLRQATDSALRAVIGKYSMDRILTEGRTVVRSDTQNELVNTIKSYDMGIVVQDVNFQAARPPEEVQAAFDDAIAARENEQQYIRQAEAYANEVQPRANGQAQRLLENAKAYRSKVVLEARGEVARFELLLPQYHAAPEIMRERIYLETMEHVLSQTHKVVMETGGSNLMVLPLEQMLQKQRASEKPATVGELPPLNAETGQTSATAPSATISIPKSSAPMNSNNMNIIEQRRQNAERDDSIRMGRN